MPRQRRQLSATGVYHIMIRGVDRQAIFRQESDNVFFLKIMSQIAEETDCVILAWCLMKNHVHLMARFDQTTPAIFMKRLGIKYAQYFNWKYERVGHLLQDRFKSEVIEDDAYLLTCFRYILQNPVKAGICDLPEEYRWSCYSEYFGENNRNGICAVDLLLYMTMGKNELRNFVNLKNDDKCLDVDEKVRDTELQKFIKELSGYEHSTEVIKMPKEKRRDVFLKLQIMGGKIRQISRLTGCSYYEVKSVLKG